MQLYKAPLRDMRFVLHELHGGVPAAVAPDNNQDVLDSVLEEASRFIAEVIAPLNASGDAEGCHYHDGVVTTPAGFKEAYRQFAEAGWGAVTADPAFGGQGLAARIGTLVSEMLGGSNLSFAMYPGLSHGVYLALRRFGSEEFKRRYLPSLVSGRWAGTMCLTEPHCGTDLGLLRTRAIPQDDGSYLITGNKIFISAGEHDLTENILHLVLARRPDAPPGIKGISLFLVPKVLLRPDDSLGERNAVRCAGIEHKLGIKASSTCQLNLDGARGWLIGEPHKGMRAMFAMMNGARLGVGIQGLSLGVAAYQKAASYARERLQGRSLSGSRNSDRAADPIVEHPDVRRMLLTMRAYNEGCRALGVWVAGALDQVEHLPEGSERTRAEDFVALMTPVVKSLFTDLGFESTNLGLQCFGGHGYLVDHGMEQLVRDVRITQIYEGTNGIQALDLVGRKLPANMGRGLRSFFHPVAQYLETHANDADLATLLPAFSKAFGALQLATGFIAQKGLSDPEEGAAAATDYLRLFGFVALGFMWIQMAKIAKEKLPSASPDDVIFYNAKIQTATFFVERLLPHVGALLAAIRAGKRSLMSFDTAAF